MKKLVSVLFIFFFGLSHFLGVNGAAIPKSPAGSPPTLSPVSDEDLGDMMKMLEGMDQNTLEALADYGRQEMEKAKAEGRDLFKEAFGVSEDDFLAEMAAAQEEQDNFVQPVAPIEEPVIAAPKAEEKKIEKDKIKSIKEMLDSILDSIESIQQKAESDRDMKDALKVWTHHIDDLVYFLHKLSEDHLTKYLPEKEFNALFNALERLQEELAFYNPLFVIVEDTINELSPYKKLGISSSASWTEINSAYQKLLAEKDVAKLRTKLKKEDADEKEIKTAIEKAQKEVDALSDAYNAIASTEQAKQAFESILDAFARAIYSNNILSEAKKVLEKHEPEALKTKEEQEEKEKKARKAQEELNKRRPPYSPPVFDPGSFGDYGYNDYGYDNNQNYNYGNDYYPNDYGYDNYDYGNYDYGNQGYDASPKSPFGDDKPETKPNNGAAETKSKKVSKDNSYDNDDSNVAKKLKTIREQISRIEDLVNNGTAATSPNTAKDYFNDFKSNVLTKAVPATPSGSDVKFLRNAQSLLLDFEFSIRQINKTLGDKKGLNKSEQDELKKEAKTLLTELKDGVLKKKIKPLLETTIDASGVAPLVSINGIAVTGITDPAQYIILGVDNYTAPAGAPASVSNANPSKENYLKSFLDQYRKLNQMIS